MLGSAGRPPWPQAMGGGAVAGTALVASAVAPGWQCLAVTSPSGRDIEELTAGPHMPGTRHPPDSAPP